MDAVENYWREICNQVIIEQVLAMRDEIAHQHAHEQWLDIQLEHADRMRHHE